MKKIRILLACLILGSLGLSALSLLLPKPGDAEISMYYSPIATSVVLVDVLFAISSAVLFLVALKHFKPELKPAYRLMAFSTIAVGLGLLIFPYIEYYGLWENIWFNVSSYAQYLIGAPLMYFGVRMFYKRLGLASVGSALWFALALVVVFSAIHPFLPYHDEWPFSLTGYNLFKIVTIVPFVLYGVAGYMAWRVGKRTGKDYRGAFTWLTIAMGFYTINTLGIILIEPIGYENWYYADRIYTVPAILGDFCLLIAGYCFAAIGRKEEEVARKNTPITSMDIITHLASMAADKTKIDGYLDVMRKVTSHMQAGDVPSAEDQEQLRQVYLDIEKHLIDNDALRSFRRDELRLVIGQHLSLDQRGQDTFWKTLQQ